MQLKSYDVFISSANKDLGFVERLEKKFKERNVSAFCISNSLYSGDNVAEATAYALKHCKLVICVVSQDAVFSNWMIREMGFACDLKKEIMPLVIDDLMEDVKQSMDDSNGHSLHHVLKGIEGTRIPSKGSLSEKKLNRLADGIAAFLKLQMDAPNATRGKKELTSVPIAKDSIKEINKKELWTENSEQWFYILELAAVLVVIPFVFSYIHNIYQVGVQGTVIMVLVYLLVAAGVFFGMVSLYRKLKYTIYFQNVQSSATREVYVDGIFCGSVLPGEILVQHQKKGMHAVYVNTPNMNDGRTFFQEFSHRNNEKVVSLGKSVNRTPQKSNFYKYRCFIAGAPEVRMERNAARAALAVLYNQYDREDFAICSYTYEDFKKSYSIDGHAYRYTEFIKEKVDCVIFVISKKVGEETVLEYQQAIEAHMNSKTQGPSVFVYNELVNADEWEQQNQSVKDFYKKVQGGHAYWRNFKDVDEMMLEVVRDVNGELMNMFLMDPFLRNRQMDKL